MVKYRICLLLLCSIYLLANTKINAQYVLQGQVSDARKAPVASASIKIKDSARGLPRFFAISDKEGKYRIRLPAGNKQFWLECSLLGYRNVSFVLPVPAGPVQLKNILLTADTADLPAINVYSIPPVTVSGDTTTFRVDAFKKGNESNVGELLNVVPGFSVNNGRISYQGRAVTKVLIEDDDLFGSD
jgi:hypothetical protein